MKKILARLAFAGAAIAAFPAAQAAETQSLQDIWWGGTGENGWGVAISAQDDRLPAMLYVYDAAGRPQWYSMPDGTWDSGHVRYGGSLYGPGNVRVGQATLVFAEDGQSGAMDYLIQGVFGSKPLQRMVFGASDGAVTSEVWPLINGTAVSITRHGDDFFVVYYGPDGRWLVMPGGQWRSGNVYKGSLLRTSSSRWLDAIYDAAQLRTTNVGTVTLDVNGGLTVVVTTIQ
jgi:hypothetical protein